MTYIKKIIGRAGTGKTTWLINEMAALIDSGVHINEIGMITFSTNAANVFKERLLERFPQYSVKHLKKFGTMHHNASSLVGWKKSENEFTADHYEKFMEKYYPDALAPVVEYDEEQYFLTAEDKRRNRNTSIYTRMEEIDGLLRGLEIEDFDFNEMFFRTGTELTYKQWSVNKQIFDQTRGKYVLKWRSFNSRISPEDQIQFSKNYREYKDEHDLKDYTDIIQECIASDLDMGVKYLFVDEFQDFNTLQYHLYRQWRDCSDFVFVVGDDAQTITRYGGADANYFISEPCDERIVLPKTFRHGKIIFNDAQRYLNKMSVVEECDVLPGEMDGEIIQVHAEEWTEHLNFTEDETVLFLAYKTEWVNILSGKLNKAIPDTYFGKLGEDRLVKRVFNHYNTIAALERGERVAWEEVKKLFSEKKCLPTEMVVTTRKTTLEGTFETHKKTQVIKKVKSQITSGSFVGRDTYDKHDFEEDFLLDQWDGKLLMNNIKDIYVFDNAPYVFPAYASDVIKKRIGTIHKSKGDEAETVFLFMDVPYAARKNIDMQEVRDDILHLFYVGKTRPRIKLVEVYGYFGEPSPFELM